jgi:hypothetical protein
VRVHVVFHTILEEQPERRIWLIAPAAVGVKAALVSGIRGEALAVSM